MSVKNLLITGSIGSVPSQSYGQKLYVSSQDNESFSIETFMGGDGGTFPLSGSISQSWSSSYHTGTGIFQFIHNTEEEFYNGEFSGSLINVTTQSLNPNIYLDANTQTISYNVFFYKTSTSSLGNFLNSNTSPNSGQLYLLWDSGSSIFSPFPPYTQTVGRGVTYAKINRNDLEGNNNTISLQELEKLRFKFSDTGIVDYEVTSISEYPSYYLYSINLKNITSSLENNILNYSFSASAYTGSTKLYMNDGNTWSGSNLASSIDSLSYFNPTTSKYTFGDTPNIKIHFSASVTLDNGLQGSFELRKNSSEVIAARSAVFAPGTYSISASFTPTENDIIQLFLFNENSGGTPSTSSNIQWQFTQSNSPNPFTSSTILEPYLISVFTNSDFDILMNNAVELETNNDFMRVLYDEGSIIPSNQTQILLRTAEPSNVKKYNYSLSSQILPRYNGIKLTGIELNKWNSGDVSFGKEPVINLQGTYFAYFDHMNATNDVLINKKLAHILYLIDKDGNIQTPTLKSPYYNNLIQNYEIQNNRASINFTTTSGSTTNIQGPQNVIRAGVFPKPIIYSQTGSNNNTVNAILFDNIYSLATIPDYRTTVTYGAIAQTTPYFNILDHSACTETAGSSYTAFNYVLNGPDNNIEITTTTNKTDGIATINLNNIYYTVGSGVFSTNAPIIVKILEYDVSTSTWNIIHTENKLIYNNIPQSFSISSPSFILTNGNKYRAALEFPIASVPTFNATIILAASSFTISQTTQPSTITVSPPYWTIGPSPSNVLTSSAFNNVYIPSNPLYQTSPLGTSSLIAGYDPVIPFKIEVNDEIRFGGDENQTYKIKQIGDASSGYNTLYLFLDRNVNPGTDINSFLIRRMVPDPNILILDIPSIGGGSGFIFNEYTTLDIQKNSDRIIQDLKSKGLIPIQ